ncbi:MAG TPA: hypothetical protein VF756_05530 [Thermoanaerobaculia bacterium]
MSNGAEKIAPKAISVIELHDATLVCLRVLAGGEVIVRLDDVSVYRPLAAGVEDVWVHAAKLSMSGVTSVLVEGIWTKADDDYVLDDRVTDHLGETVRWLDLSAAELQQIHLHLFSGARIVVNCSRAALKLARKGKVVRQWRKS